MEQLTQYSRDCISETNLVGTLHKQYMTKKLMYIYLLKCILT